MSIFLVGDEYTKIFERVSGWREASKFEADNDGYITTERVGEGSEMFLWRVDEEPCHLDHTFLGGKTFVRFSNR